MSVFLIGKFYHYDFVLDGRRYKATTGKTSKQAAQRVERDERMRLESGYSEILQREERAQGRKTIKEASAAFLVEYLIEGRPAFVARAAPTVPEIRLPMLRAASDRARTSCATTAKPLPTVPA